MSGKISSDRPARVAARRALSFVARSVTASLCCLALAASVSADVSAGQASSSSATTRDEIESVRRRYASIRRRMPRMRRVSLDLSGQSAEGGRLVAYFDGGELRLLRAAYYGETGRNEEEYYFDAGRLFFVFTKESNYDKPFGRVVSAPENRFYFREGKLLRWLGPSGREVSPARADFAARETELLKSADELASRAKKKRSAARG